MYYTPGMSEVPVRVLNQETSSILTRVKQGEEIDITERGVVIGRIVPAAPSPLGDMIAAGKLRPAAAKGAIPRPAGPIRTNSEAGSLVSDMRDEERY